MSTVPVFFWRRTPLAWGDNTDIALTVGRMRDMMLAPGNLTVLTAEHLDSVFADLDPLAKAEAVLLYVRRVVKFRQEKDEVLKTSDVMLYEASVAPERFAYGDCDDGVILAGSLYLCMGYPVKIVVISKRGDLIYWHVYLAVQVHEEWFPVDPISEGRPLGWEWDGPVTARAEIEVG